MSDYRQGLLYPVLVLCFGAALSSVGFIASDYFNAVNRHEQFVNELHKNLYDKWFDVESLIQHELNDVYSVLASDYGVSTYQLEKSLSELEYAKEQAYWEYENELQKYGTYQQVSVQKKFTTWLNKIISGLREQYNLALSIQKKAEDLHRVENVDGDQYKFINDDLDSKIKLLIEKENTLYDSYTSIETSKKQLLVDLINYQFRQTLKLTQLVETETLTDKLTSLDDREISYNSDISEYPFLYAEYRTGKFKAGDKTGLTDELIKNFNRAILFERQYVNDRNAFIRMSVKDKFMNLAIEKNPDLAQLLSERSEKASDSQN